VSKSLTDLARKLVLGWADGEGAPDATIDAAGPRLAATLGLTPEQLELETLTTDAPLHEIELDFPELFDGSFRFVVPDAWQHYEAEESAAWLYDDDTVRASIVVLPLEVWRLQLERFFAANDVEALWVRRRGAAPYLQWVWVTGAGNEDEPWWVWSINTSGDYLVVSKADAADADSLRALLVCALNSSPWQGWIEAALQQRTQSSN
jgi:hypothetical protein